MMCDADTGEFQSLIRTSEEKWQLISETDGRSDIIHPVRIKGAPSPTDSTTGEKNIDGLTAAKYCEGR